jgi:hypothetical protein
MCARCGQGLLLDEDQGLAPISISFATGIPPDTEGHPFWVADGTVSMARETYSVFGKKTDESETFWSRSHRYFVPAFDCSLDRLVNLGTQLLQQPPVLQPGTPVPFEPVTLSPRDVPALAEFIVVAIEAGRRDKVKQIEVVLQLSEPELWVLP